MLQFGDSQSLLMVAPFFDLVHLASAVSLRLFCRLLVGLEDFVRIAGSSAQAWHPDANEVENRAVFSVPYASLIHRSSGTL